jgi:hypothetical protein
LVGHDVVFVFGVDGHVVGCEEDGVRGEGEAGEFFEEVGVGGVVEVEVGARGVAGHVERVEGGREGKFVDGFVEW